MRATTLTANEGFVRAVTNQVGVILMSLLTSYYHSLPYVIYRESCLMLSSMLPKHFQKCSNPNLKLDDFIMNSF